MFVGIPINLAVDKYKSTLKLKVFIEQMDTGQWINSRQIKDVGNRNVQSFDD